MRTITRLVIIIIFWEMLAGCSPSIQNTPPIIQITDIPIPTDEPTIIPQPTQLVNIPIAPSVENLAPNFKLTDIDGNIYELWKLRGNPVLINFWATWCGPCLAEMPAIQSIFERYSNQGLLVLAVNGDGEAYSDIYNYRQENGLSFPMLIDTGKNAANTYQIEAFPTSIFIDRNGVIKLISSGAMEEQDFDQTLNSTILGNVNQTIPITANTSPSLELSGEFWSSEITEPHLYSSSLVSEKNFYNFAIQSDIEIKTDSHEYHGLLFRQQDDKNFYTFRITADGYFQFDVWQTGDNSFETILGPTQSIFIRQGVGQINTLKVTSKLENFNLYINGEYVGSISDSRFQAGKVGVISCTCDGSSNASASFQNFSLFDLP